MKRFAILLCVMLAFMPDAGWAVFDSETLDINRWKILLSNRGDFCVGEWPNGSGHHCIFGAGLWVGAVPGDTYTAVSYNPNSWYSEFAPGDSAGGDSDPNVRVYVYPRDWPPPAGRFPHAPQVRRSDQDAWCCFDDFDTTRHEVHPTGPRRSLGLQDYLTTYASVSVPAADFVYLRYEFENQGSETLHAVCAGIAMDADVGDATNDRYRGYWHRWFPRGSGDSVLVDNLACIHSADEPGWDTTGTIAVELIRTPGGQGATAMKTFTLGGGDPARDAQQYLTLAGYDWWTSPPIYNPIDSQSPAPSDQRFLLATGPFDLAPGQAESLVAVIIGVNAQPTGDSLRIFEAAWIAESLYFAGLPQGAEERSTPDTSRATSLPTMVRDRLVLPASFVTRAASCVLLDITGRRVGTLSPGVNDLRRFGPGVYFVQQETLHKLVIAR
jgi:hypothetical protein